MSTHDLAVIGRLTDCELISRVKALAAREREATTELIAHLGVLDMRDVHLRQGHASLFAFCREVLCLSESAAYNRIEVARAARCPAGANVNGSGLGVLKTATPSVPTAEGASTGPPGAPATVPLPRPRENASAPTPLSPDRYRLQVTIDGSTVEKLRLAQDMLRHAVPSGSEAEILSRALDALLADLAKKKFAATDRPRPAATGAPTPHYVPAAVKRAVWIRDRGRCAFVGAAGRRCQERAWLEFHHIHPVALGGVATVESVSLRCKRHHGCETRADFGERACPGTSRLERIAHRPGPPAAPSGS
jgi:hypothetical protein